MHAGAALATARSRPAGPAVIRPQRCAPHKKRALAARRRGGAAGTVCHTPAAGLDCLTATPGSVPDNLAEAAAEAVRTQSAFLEENHT